MKERGISNVEYMSVGEYKEYLQSRVKEYCKIEGKVIKRIMEKIDEDDVSLSELSKVLSIVNGSLDRLSLYSMVDNVGANVSESGSKVLNTMNNFRLSVYKGVDEDKVNDISVVGDIAEGSLCLNGSSVIISGSGVDVSESEDDDGMSNRIVEL